jgi:hypothetical protein
MRKFLPKNESPFFKVFSVKACWVRMKQSGKIPRLIRSVARSTYELG